MDLSAVSPEEALIDALLESSPRGVARAALLVARTRPRPRLHH